MNKNIGAVLLVVAVVAGGWYLLSGHKPNLTAGVAAANEPVATVNGITITRGQLTTLESQLAAQQGLSATSTEAQAKSESSALDSLIAQALLASAAEKAGIVASSTAVDERIAGIRKQFATDSDFEKALAAQSLTPDTFRANVTRNLIINDFLEKQFQLSTIKASDAEIQVLYKQEMAGQPAGSPSPKLSEIRDQIATMVVQQKQMAIINTYIAQTRSSADIKILISTSTPAAQ